MTAKSFFSNFNMSRSKRKSTEEVPPKKGKALRIEPEAPSPPPPKVSSKKTKKETAKKSKGKPPKEPEEEEEEDEEKDEKSEEKASNILDLDKFKKSVLCMSSTFTLKKNGENDVGDAYPTKGGPREKLVEGDFFPNLADLHYSFGFNWRRILSYDHVQQPPLRMCISHAHDNTCFFTKCEKKVEEEVLTFATLRHAIYTRRFQQPYARLFALESNSDICSTAEAATRFVKAKMKKPKDGSVFNLQIKEKSEWLWERLCISELFQQNWAFRQCLLATKDAVLTQKSPSIVLAALMDIRDKPPSATCIRCPDEAVRKACEEMKLPGLCPNEFHVFTGGGLLIVPGFSVPFDEYALVCRGHALREAVVRFWRTRPFLFLSHQQTYNIQVSPVPRGQVVHSVAF